MLTISTFGADAIVPAAAKAAQVQLIVEKALSSGAVSPELVSIFRSMTTADQDELSARAIQEVFLDAGKRSSIESSLAEARKPVVVNVPPKTPPAASKGMSRNQKIAIGAAIGVGGIALSTLVWRMIAR